MISLDASGHAWRTCMCDVLADKHDYNDSQVATLFAESADWARKYNAEQQKLKQPELAIELDPKVDYLANYLATRDRGEPKVPEHVRRYCAHLKGISLEVPELPAAPPRESAKLSKSAPVSKRVPRKERYRRRAAVH